MKNLKYLVLILGSLSFFALDGYLILGLIMGVATIVLGTYLRKQYGKSIVISIGEIFAGMRVLVVILLFIFEILGY